MKKKLYVVCAPTSEDELKTFKTKKEALNYIEDNRILFYPHLMLIKYKYKN